MRIRKFILLILLSSSVIFGFDKTGTTSFQFLQVMTTARAYAMAGAYTTLANGSDAVFWNPAGLIRVENISAGAGYTDWFMDVKHYSASIAYNYENVGTFGVFALIADAGKIYETKVSQLGFRGEVYNPGLTGRSFNLNSMAIGISYARELNDRFSFGINVKYANEDLILESAGALVFDGGFIYDTGYKTLVIGAALRNFGQEVKFVDRSFPLPQILNIGISGYLIGGPDPIITSLGNNNLIASFDIVQPRDFGQQYNVGLEYSTDDMFFLRGGYKINGDQEGLSFGGGVKFMGYEVDYAYSDYGEYLDSVHRVSLGININ